MRLSMVTFCLAALAVRTTDGGRAPPDDPRALVRSAAAAVRSDSVAVYRDRWRRRLAADTTDRAAVLGLATLARLTYDYPEANRLYRAMVSADSPSDRYAVYAWLGWGQGYEEYGRDAHLLFVQALEAARALGDSSAIGEALTWLGYVRTRSSGLDVGVAHYDSALRILPRRDADLRAVAGCRRAQSFVLLGRGAERARLASALDAARRVGLPRVVAPCLRAQASLLGHQGKFEAAAALYERLAEAYRRAHDPSGRALTLDWAAAIYREDLADYARAQRTLAAAQADAEASHNRYADVITRLYRGQIALTLNDYAAARRHLDDAVSAAEAVGDGEVLAVCRSWRALVHLAVGDLGRARRESLETLEFFRNEGDLENQSEVVQSLANIAIRERNWPEAERALDSSEALLRRLGASPDQIAQSSERGRLALYRGDLSAAEATFSAALERLDSAAHLRRYETQAYLAEVHARRGDLDGAERQLTAASDELDRWRAGLSLRDLRIAAFQANASAQNDRNASVAEVLAALAAGGRAEAAFALAERRRARELADRLTQDRALVSGKIPAGGAVTRDAGRLSAYDIARHLPEHTALLEFVTGALGSPTTVFVLTSSVTGPVVQARVLAPADSLTGAIARFLALITRDTDLRTEATALGARLLQPAAELLGPEITRLVIVPDGVLHRVPWDALRLADGREAVERFAIGIAPSATIASVLRTGAKAPPSARYGRVLAFGDPVFSPTDRSPEGFQAAFSSSGGLPSLPGSGAEARAVSRHADADLWLGPDASEHRLKTLSLTPYSVLHFATHALVDERVAVRTALALTPGGGEDGFVTPGELGRLRLNADLVVLSACRTAGGVVVDGEGMQGLTAPLLEAGARSVVATSWRVGDQSTVPLVEALYAGLARALPVVDALQGAKLEARRGGASPAVWAAFTVVGDPLATVALRPFAPPERRP
ncbi:MAG TPA: CHAT domain-containing protein [Gemmatimonadales bacterium]|nr:CHAT domain-containing protein [Gemmatimonadales bacterium]